MLRLIIVASLFSAALSLKVNTPVRSEDNPAVDQLKEELQDLKNQLKKKEATEQAKEQKDSATKAELQKKIDDALEAEAKEDKADAKSQEAMKDQIKKLREQVNALTDPDAKKGSEKDSLLLVAEQKPEKKEADKKEKADHDQGPDLKAVEAGLDHASQPKLAPRNTKFDAAEVFPVPTTSRCIVIMCCQYMIVYLALAVCRTYLELMGQAKGKVEASLRAATQTLTYGPMLCVLFIACRMRVEFLSDGKGQPQMWVQNCMYALTWSVLASTILVLLMPLVSGKPLVLKEGTCDLEKPELREGDSKVAFYALAAARYLILLGLYGGLAGVIVGICTYTPTGADLSKLPAPAPAVMCTMILATAFFVTQLVIAFCRSYTEFKGVEFPKIVGMMHAAANTMEFAPMLSILFLAARMRALQHDEQPQEWAQTCMYSATTALCMTTVLAILVPSVMGGCIKTNAVTKETTFEVYNGNLGYVLLALRFLCMLGFYGGAVGVSCSIFTFEAPAGPAATLPVSPTVHCVVNLTCQFFFVYLMQTIMLTVSEISGGSMPLEKFKLFNAVDSAKSTLAFAPMLSILFVTTRMYALLITDKKGAPQAWVQDGMYMATWSLLISFVACLATGLVLDTVETDEDGNVVNKFSNKYAAILMVVVRYASMLLLYGGICMVIVGLFVMTPETANGRGSLPIVSDITNATPIGNAPPGPGDVPKVDSGWGAAGGLWIAR